MSVDLEKLGRMVDEALANETKESLTKWLNERRQNAETGESNCTIDSVISWAFNSPKKSGRYLILDDLGWIGYRTYNGVDWEYGNRTKVLMWAVVVPPCL
jgi:hypothetical protein